MDIKNDTIYQIKSKVLLFTKKKYFSLFRNIFIQNTLTYLSSKNEKHIALNSRIKLSSNKDKKSLWEIVSKSIKTEKEIINYDLNNYRQSHDEENEDDHFLEYLLNQSAVIKINNLVFSYLNKISNIKLHRLISISVKEKMHLINLMKIYLGLCSQNFNKRNIEIKTGKNLEKIFNKKIAIKYNNNEKSIKKFERKSVSKEKLNDSIKKSISANKSKIEGDTDNQKNNSISAYDEMINEQIQKSLNRLNIKNKGINSKILYSSSFARLFIGDTDKESIREKYLSNFEIKKEKKLKKNQNKNLSSIFYKVFLTRLEQNKNNSLPSIEKGVENILLKFKKNQEIIDKFRRSKNKTFYEDLKRLNKTSNKSSKKIIYIMKNVNTNLNRNKKFGNMNKKKLIKTTINKKKLLDINFNKIDISDNNKNTKYSSFSYDKYRLNHINKPKDKAKFIYDYNYNSTLKNYLNLNNLNQNNMNKFKEKEKYEIKTNKIKEKFFNRKIYYNYNIITNGNLTTRGKKHNDDKCLNNYKLNQNYSQRNYNIINYLNKNDLFFDNL